MSNDAVLDTTGAVRREAGVNERPSEQFSQGDRSFYAGAFCGSTPIGAAKGNQPALPGQAPMAAPFKNLRGGSR